MEIKLKELIKEGKDFEALEYLMKVVPNMTLKDADRVMKELQTESLTLKELQTESLTLKELGIDMLKVEEYLPSKKSFNEREFGLNLDSSEEE